MAEPNLIDKLAQALPSDTHRALDALVRTAQRSGLSLYLVGGSVRDLLLDRPNLDVDLTVEADAPTLARRFASGRPGVRCVVHRAFGTATLKGPAFRLDLATARAEMYERPGALPTVQPGPLRDDLFRRDFTVNAIAIALTSDHRGEIIDPFNGMADLKAGLLRFLHDASFQDDATRILRGARYESRLGFRFQRSTLRRLKRDVGYLRSISGPRVRQELINVFRELEPEHVLRRLDRLGALSAIHPALSFDAARVRAFRRLRGFGVDVAASKFALLAWGLTARQSQQLASHLAIRSYESAAVIATVRARSLQNRLARAKKPSRVVQILSPLPFPGIWALAAAGDQPARRLALRYLRRWRYAKPALDGHALQAMGARPGPRLGEVLRRLKAAKLDGEVRSRKDEEALARRLLRSRSETRR